MYEGYTVNKRKQISENVKVKMSNNTNTPNRTDRCFGRGNYRFVDNRLFGPALVEGPY